MSLLKNSVSFGQALRKTGQRPGFSIKSKEAVPKTEVLEQPHMKKKGVRRGFIKFPAVLCRLALFLPPSARTNTSIKTVSLLALLLVFLVSPLWALDFGVRVRPYLSFPIGDSGDLFTFGGGADAILDLDLSSIWGNPLDLGYSVGPEVSYNYFSFNADSGMSVITGGLGLSLFYYFNRISVRGGGALGLYNASYTMAGLENSYLNTWWSYSGEVGFRFSPTFILSGYAGYRRYNSQPGDPLYSGIFAGISARLAFETGERADNIAVELSQEEPVFPIYMGLYRENQIGTLRLTNHESAEIRNVTVSFRAGNYTASQYPCGTIPLLGKNRTAEIPLFADFSAQLFNFSEDGKIPGEVIIRYELLGAERSSSGQVVVSVYNRNSFRWFDPASLAVFVSPTAPELLDYSKYIVGIARNRMRTALNQKMQQAVFLFEGLRAAGIADSLDAQTPYAEYHQNSERVDYVQFPFQTLAYRMGDLDDLGLLFAGVLEAAGIKSAIIPMADDFLVAFSLDIDAASAGNFFNDVDNLLIIDDTVWMPVAMSSLAEGFINCWYNAVNRINFAVENGDDVNFIILEDAWTLYPPAAMSVQDIQYDKPLEAAVSRLAETDMLRYISSEFNPKILAVQNEIRTQGGSVTLYNRLGLLYVRAGMYNEANAEYQRSAALGSAAAMVNLGNLAILSRDFSAAEQWFTRALRIDPRNRSAQNGLNQVVGRSLGPAQK
jgi:TPR repeat protein